MTTEAELLKKYEDSSYVTCPRCEEFETLKPIAPTCVDVDLGADHPYKCFNCGLKIIDHYKFTHSTIEITEDTRSETKNAS